jgi:hypothetical protein
MIWRVLIFFLLLSSAAFAQVSNDCAIPTANFDPDAPEQERLEGAIAIREYMLCVAIKESNASNRVRPSADADFMADIIEIRRADLALLKSRLSFPPLEDIREAVVATGRPDQEVKYTHYLFATAELHYLENCEGKLNGVCPISPPMQNVVPQSYGMQVRPWVEKTAKELRLSPMLPWFRLGSVSVRYEPDSLAHLRIKAALEVAVSDQNAAQKHLTARRKVASQAREKRRENLDPIRARVSSAQEELFAMEQARRPNAEAAVASQQWDNYAHMAKVAEKRMGELDARIAHVFETEGDRPAGQKRIKKMQVERDGESEISEKAWADRAAMLEPDYTVKELVRRKELNDAIKVDQLDHDRRARLHSGWIAEADGAVATAQIVLEQADAALASTQTKMQNWQASYALMKLTRLETKHATLLPAEEEELKEMQVQILELRQEIDRRVGLRAGMLEGRKKARKEMMDAGAHADAMNIKLDHAGRVSLVAQVAIEVGIVAYDLWDANKKGGPQAMLVVAGQTLASNMIWPPSYVDATRQKISDFAIGQDGPDDWELVNIDPQAIAERAPGLIEKQWRQMPFKVMLQVLKEDAARAAVDKSWKRYLYTSVDKVGFLRTIGAREIELEKITAEMAQMTGKAGLRAAAKHFSGKLIEGLAKSLAKDGAKKLVAEVVEGHYFEEYMVSQLALGQTVSRLQHAGNLYWTNEDAISVLRAILSGILLRDPGPTVLTPEKNNPFYAKPDYRFELTFPDATPKDLAGANITVTVGGVKLVRDANSTAPVWRMPKNARKAFGPELSEDLPIEILLR